MSKKIKRYEIESFEQLVNVVNCDNVGFVAQDLVLWLTYVAIVSAQIRKNNPEYSKDKTNWDLAKCSFIWIDDGKNDMKEVTIKNHLTGEVKKFKINHPKS